MVGPALLNHPRNLFILYLHPYRDGLEQIREGKKSAVNGLRGRKGAIEVGHMSSIRKKQQGNSLRVSAYVPGLVLGSWYSMFSPFIINSFIH